MLAAAPAASAGTASDDEYGAVLGQQAGPGATQGAGTLPFTGLDLVLVAGLGSGLAAAGIAVRRLAGRSQPAEPAA